MATHLMLGDISVEVARKDIKNVHLSVYPPEGRVRIAAPRLMKLNTIRVYAISKLDWIRKQQRKLRAQERESPRDYTDRETHYVWGQRCLLRIQEAPAPARVVLRGNKLILTGPRDTTPEQRAKLIDGWYRRQLREKASPIIASWEKRLNVSVARFFVQRMKTRWGSCNSDAKSIRLNLELAKKPAQCLEYVIIHEMVHFKVRHHNSRFIQLLDEHLPQWRAVRDELNRLPLSERHCTPR